MRPMILFAALAVIPLTSVTEALAQDGATPCSNNNLKQLGIATMPPSTTGPQSPPIGLRNLARDLSGQVQICGGGDGYLYVAIPDTPPAQAQVQGCPTNVAKTGLGDNLQVVSRQQADGSLWVRITSTRQRSCSLTAVLRQTERGPLPSTPP